MEFVAPRLNMYIATTHTGLYNYIANNFSATQNSNI